MFVFMQQLCAHWIVLAREHAKTVFSHLKRSVACAVEVNLAWNLTEREHLTCTIILWRNWAAGMLLVFFFRLEWESVQNWVYSLYSFLGGETQKAITHLKGFSNLSNWKEAWKKKNQGFNGIGTHDFFQASSFQLLKLENLLRWSHFTFI